MDVDNGPVGAIGTSAGIPDDDDLDVRQLIERLEHHHDCMMSRQDSVISQQDARHSELLAAVRADTDELKQLMLKGTMNAPTAESSLTALNTLSAEILTRSAQEHHLLAMETSVLRHMLHLRSLLEGNPGSSVMAVQLLGPEIAQDLVLEHVSVLNDDIIGRVVTICDLISKLQASFEREMNRRRRSAGVWDAVATINSCLPDEESGRLFAEALVTLHEASGDSEVAIKAMLSTLSTFAPCGQEICGSLGGTSTECVTAGDVARETQNPAKVNEVVDLYGEKFILVLRDLLNALGEIGGSATRRKILADTEREKERAIVEDVQQHLQRRKEVVDTLPAQGQLKMSQGSPEPSEPPVQPSAHAAPITKKSVSFADQPGDVVAEEEDNLTVSTEETADEVLNAGELREMDDVKERLATEGARQTEKEHELLEDNKNAVAEMLQNRDDVSEKQKNIILAEYEKDKATLEDALALEKQRQEEELCAKILERNMLRKNKAKARSEALAALELEQERAKKELSQQHSAEVATQVCSPFPNVMRFVWFEVHTITPSFSVALIDMLTSCRPKRLNWKKGPCYRKRITKQKT